MATEKMIDIAAKPERGPVGGEFGEALLYMPHGMPEDEIAERILAARCARRFAGDDAVEILQALGLMEAP